MPLHATEAIVIGGHDLAEADRIVVFYTKTGGKLRAVAEGARRLRTRFGGNLQLFAEGKLVYFERPNRTLHKVNEFAVIRSHKVLREDLDRMAFGATTVEAVALGVEEGEAHPDLYRMLADGLDLLEEAAHPEVLMQGFLLHLLRLLGYKPELAVCVRCRSGIPTGTGGHISAGMGGLICERCLQGVADATPTSSAGLGFLRGAGAASLRIMDRVAIAPQTLGEVRGILEAFLRHVLGRPLRSTGFLERL